MGDFSGLLQAARPFCETISKSAGAEEEICLITHLDADGITSGSIMAAALGRMGARFSLRTVSDMNGPLISSLKAENHDLVVFTDIGGGWASELEKSFQGKWLVIDHHQLSGEEMITDDSNHIFNAWKYSVDGGLEISAGGMAYAVAVGLDAGN